MQQTQNNQIKRVNNNIGQESSVLRYELSLSTSPKMSGQFTVFTETTTFLKVVMV